MKFSIVFIASMFFASVAVSEESPTEKINTGIDKQSNALKGAINKKMPKKEAKPAGPSTADKAAAKKDELKAKAAAAGAKADAKVDGALKSLGN